MRPPRQIIVAANKAREWWLLNRQLVGKVLGCVAAFLSICLAIRATHPAQELRFEVLRKFVEVFNRERDPHLLVLARNQAVNSKPGGNTVSGELLDGQATIALNGHTWRLCPDSLGAFEIRIVNNGTKPLWHGASDTRPEGAKPICIETDPPVEVFDARVAEGDISKNEFIVCEDEKWRIGRVECRWRVLESGESVVVRVVHARAAGAMQISLTGELNECLAPKKWGILQEMRGIAKQTFSVGSFWILFAVATVAMWSIASVRVARKKRADAPLKERLIIPEGIAPTRMSYWTREVLLRVWFLLCITLLVIYFVTS